jgi:putative ABC transport system permease protein
VLAADLDLPGTVGAEMWRGQWLTDTTSRYPAVVLGRTAADRLGVSAPDLRTVVLVGGVPSTVVGILAPVPLAPELDTSILVGRDFARDRLGWDGQPTRIYVRAAPAHVEAVRGVIGATANPAAPNEVNVSRPSDALAAQAATDSAFTGLLLGLGAVALLVGGIGVANTMVISVMERRAEIGLRRSLGATHGHVLRQFLVESLVLSVLGGVGGVVLGVVITAGYARTQGWETAVPLVVVAAGIGLTMVTGMVAGIVPAFRAARLSPTAALTA